MCVPKSKYEILINYLLEKDSKIKISPATLIFLEMKKFTHIQEKLGDDFYNTLFKNLNPGAPTQIIKSKYLNVLKKIDLNLHNDIQMYLKSDIHSPTHLDINKLIFIKGIDLKLTIDERYNIKKMSQSEINEFFYKKAHVEYVKEMRKKRYKFVPHIDCKDRLHKTKIPIPEFLSRNFLGRNITNMDHIISTRTPEEIYDIKGGPIIKLTRKSLAELELEFQQVTLIREEEPEFYILNPEYSEKLVKLGDILEDPIRTLQITGYDPEDIVTDLNYTLNTLLSDPEVIKEVEISFIDHFLYFFKSSSFMELVLNVISGYFGF